MTSELRKRVILAYASLLRTQIQTFKTDTRGRKVALDKMREEFGKNKNLTDTKAIEDAIKLSYDVVNVLKNNVVQGVKHEKNTYGMIFLIIYCDLRVIIISPFSFCLFKMIVLSPVCLCMIFLFIYYDLRVLFVFVCYCVCYYRLFSLFIIRWSVHLCVHECSCVFVLSLSDYLFTTQSLNLIKAKQAECSNQLFKNKSKNSPPKKVPLSFPLPFPSPFLFFWLLKEINTAYFVLSLSKNYKLISTEKLTLTIEERKREGWFY